MTLKNIDACVYIRFLITSMPIAFTYHPRCISMNVQSLSARQAFRFLLVKKKMIINLLTLWPRFNRIRNSMRHRENNFQSTTTRPFDVCTRAARILDGGPGGYFISSFFFACHSSHSVLRRTRRVRVSGSPAHRQISFLDRLSPLDFRLRYHLRVAAVANGLSHRAVCFCLTLTFDCASSPFLLKSDDAGESSERKDFLSFYLLFFRLRCASFL